MGRTGFAVPEPPDPVILATSLHDIGWLDGERRPRLNDETGLPTEFREVPTEQHTKLWRAGIADAAACGLFPARVAARRCYLRKSIDRFKPTPDVVREFLAGQKERQTTLIEKLDPQPGLGNALSKDQLALSKRLIAALDAMSLNLCWGVRDEVTIGDVPRADGTGVTLTLAGDPDRVTVRHGPS